MRKVINTAKDIMEENVTCPSCHSEDVTQNEDGSYYCNKCHKNFEDKAKPKKDEDSGNPKDSAEEADAKTEVADENKDNVKQRKSVKAKK